jgi:hypothetical protein
VTLRLALFYVALIWAPLLAMAWAYACEWYADRCTCRKGGWNPECPRHGRTA